MGRSMAILICGVGDGCRNGEVLPSGGAGFTMCGKVAVEEQGL
jgi:hypothetical protein